jgi:hypothetical protein
VRADNALRSNFGVVEHSSAHADEAPIADGTSMDDGAVPDGYIFADESGGHAVTRMHENVFLKVGPAADLYALYIAAKYHVEEYRDVVADGRIADYPGIRRHKSGGADHRGFLFEGNNRHVQRLAVFYEGLLYPQIARTS